MTTCTPIHPAVLFLGRKSVPEISFQCLKDLLPEFELLVRIVFQHVMVEMEDSVVVVDLVSIPFFTDRYVFSLMPVTLLTSWMDNILPSTGVVRRISSKTAPNSELGRLNFII